MLRALVKEPSPPEAPPAPPAPPAPEAPEPKALDDAAVDAATLKELRGAYRELRAAYDDLHDRHHARITDALADRKADGKKTGGDVPYGYRLEADGETLVEDAAEQAVIAEAARLRAQGLSLRRIARELWKQRMRPRPVPRGKRRNLTSKRAGEFDPTQIRRMLETRPAGDQPQ